MHTRVKSATFQKGLVSATHSRNVVPYFSTVKRKEKKMEKLYRYKKRLFVVLCACNSRHKIRSWAEDAGFNAVHIWEGEFNGKCNKCRINRFIILPKGER